MPITNTSNAIGTARQFTPQPQGTYQKNLINPQFGNAIGISQTSRGQQLADSLGVLASAIDQYANDHEKRQKEIAEKVVPMIYGKEDHETRLTMDGITMLTKAGYGDLIDNPYAKAVLDRRKGQEIGAEIHAKYQAYTSQEKLKGTLAEEIKSYDQFFNENVESYLDKTAINNRYAMDAGLYESRVVNTAKVANQFVAEKSEEMSINRAESIGSFISENTRNRWKWTGEEEDAFVSQIGNLLTMTQERDPTKNYQILSKLVKTIAQNTGNYQLLEKLKDTTVYGNYKVGDFINIEQYKDLANEANKTHWMERTRTIYDAVSKAKDKKSLYDIVDGFKDPEDRAIASGFVSGQLGSIEAEARQQRAIELATQKVRAEAQRGQMNMKAQLTAIINGQTKDAMGNGIAMNESQMKSLGYSVDDVVMAVDGIIEGLNFDDPASMSQLMRLTTYPPYKSAAGKAFTYNATAGINSLTLDNPVPSPMLQRCLDLYKKSPSVFNDLVSDPTVQSSIMCIATQGVEKYLLVRDVLSNPTELARIDGELAQPATNGLATISMPSLSGGESSYEGLTDPNNEPNSALLRETYKNYARVYRAMGLSPEEAVRQTNYRIASEFYAFQGAPIPKAAIRLVDIGGTDEDTARSAFYWVLGTRFNDFCKSKGLSPSAVTVTYSNSKGNGSAMITFASPAGTVFYPLIGANGIVDEAKANLQQSGNQVYSSSTPIDNVQVYGEATIDKAGTPVSEREAQEAYEVDPSGGATMLFNGR